MSDMLNNALIRKLNTAKRFIHCESGIKQATLMDAIDAAIINLMRNQSVVKCKECRFYPNGEGATKWLPCREVITPPAWYCADGERKDDGHQRD